MTNEILIDAVHQEETRIAIIKDKRLEDYDLINDTSVSFIWKGLKVSKNTLTGNVTIYDTNAKEYTIMSNKFLLSLIHKELKENKE